MTQDEIYDMAHQAGVENEFNYDFRLSLETFAKLVAAKEREACAKVVDARLEKWEKIIGKDKMYKWMRGLPEVIRARGEQA
jgi:hypothetical protein